MRVLWTMFGFFVTAATMAQQPSSILATENNLRFRDVAEKTFLQYEQSLSAHCSEVNPDWTRATYVIYVQPTNDAQGRLVGASWSQLVPGTACGQPRRFRALVTVHDGRPGVSRQLPGTSNVSLALEHDVRVAITSAAQVHLSPTKLDPLPLDVFDTDLAGDALPAARRVGTKCGLSRLAAIV